MTSIDFPRVRSFLVDQALPFWSRTGRYDNGCFVEHCDLGGAPVDPGYTRVRVQARQIYVLCHAHLLGLMDTEHRCDGSVSFFIDAAWLGPEEGWARRIDRAGNAIDRAFDFYDVSFALFALGWYYRLRKDPNCLLIAHQTLDFLERHASHAAGGFINDHMRSLPRQQNPHMHFVEAMNVWFEATGDMRFAEMAEAVLRLFEHKFCDPATGALYEFFNDDWSRLEGGAGQIVEPGHQFEWAWIIGHNGRLTGHPRLGLMRKLLDHGLRYGLDIETGLTLDQVDGAGNVLQASRRLWPQTETIKAALAEFEFLGVDTSSQIARTLTALFHYFLDPGPLPGTWIDHYAPDGRPIVDKIPASSLYHVSLAFFELLRLEGDITGNKFAGVGSSIPSIAS